MKSLRELREEIKVLDEKRHILDCQIVEIDSRLEDLNEQLLDRKQEVGLMDWRDIEKVRV